MRINKNIKNAAMLRQSDIITHAKYNMTAYEKNLLTCLLKEMQNQKFEPNIYYIDLAQMCKDSDTEYKEAYFEDACIRLRKRDFIERGQYKFFVGGFVDNAEIDHQAKKAIITVSPQVKRAYSNMTRYTKYDDIIQLKFESYYTKRIYEQISKFAEKTVWYISVDGLRELLGLVNPDTGKSKFKQFSQLRESIIEKAYESFKENSEYIFEWSVHRKEGKAITWLRFDIYKNQKYLLLFENKFYDTSKAETIKKLVEKFGLGDSQAETIAFNFEQKVIDSKLFDITIRNMNKEIKGELSSYTITAFHNLKPSLQLRKEKKEDDKS